MTRDYCRHDMPADQCALCAPRRPVPRHLVACSYPDGSGVCVHRADCQHAEPPTDGRTPWPRWDVAEAEVREHPEWDRCKACQP